MSLKPVFLSLGIASIFTLSACASRPATPDTATVPFILERDFAGKTIGKGRFTSINGIDRGFTAYLNGIWDGETLTLVEDFEYDDGEIDQKTWRLTKLDNGEFSGTREDVVGTARGYQDGNAFRLEYQMQLPKDDGSPGMKVRFQDVIFKKQDGSIINNATVGYLGFRVGRVSLTITPAKNDDVASEKPLAGS